MGALPNAAKERRLADGYVRARHRSTAGGPRAVRVGGRSARIVAEVLRATAEELVRVGYSALRMEDVARVAGVNKTTVYRRWPTKMQLVTETLRLECEHRDVAPDTGSVREDSLRLMLNAFAEQGCTPLACAWLSELGNSEVKAIGHAFRHEFESRWAAVIARGMVRAELPPDTSPLFLIEILVSPVMGRLVRGEAAPTDQFCTQVIDLVLAGTRAVASPART